MRKMLKRVLTTALALTMSLSLAACGDAKKNDDKDGDNNAAVSGEMPAGFDMTAVEFTRLMGNGINLGNTMEATGRTTESAKGSPAGSVAACETAWGQPITTPEIIQGMKDSGFDTIRIPVAWTNMMDYANDDFTIPTEYLDRVEEIVNYALDADMYVIVNDHWDGGWYGLFGQEDSALQEKAWNIYEAIWTQVGERFKDYDERLVFESANEELCTRLNDKIDGVEGILNQDECYAKTNEINQKFVDIIRSQGSNNAYRFLLIAGFGTDINNTLDERFVMPTDTADSKLMISVHYYDPTGYCLYDVNNWGTKDDYEDVNNQLARMKTFVDQGYGVIIGEYGVLPEYDSTTGSQTVKPTTLEYTTNLLANCDMYGYVPVLWDCNGLYNREACKVIDAELLRLFQKNSNAFTSEKTQADLEAAAQKTMDDLIANAGDGFVLEDDKAMAWIMYTSGDWNTTYIVGDIYDPTNASSVVVGSDVEITGEGTYTVSLDFTGVNGGYVDGTQFMALGLANGETLYPDYVIDIKSVLVNGEEITFNAKPYTSSDNQICTRVNLYNQWVADKDIDKDSVRTVDGVKEGISAQLIAPEALNGMKSIEITFDYVAP